MEIGKPVRRIKIEPVENPAKPLPVPVEPVKPPEKVGV